MKQRLPVSAIREYLQALRWDIVAHLYELEHGSVNPELAEHTASFLLKYGVFVNPGYSIDADDPAAFRRVVESLIVRRKHELASLDALAGAFDLSLTGIERQYALGTEAEEE